jgi:large subunit ribosomal protein L23
MHAFQVLIRPVVTEKSTLLQEQDKYVFQVDSRANKVMIREAVEKAYDVKVISVNTVKTHGKMKRYGPRWTKRPDTKKAIVSLKQGERIQIFEGA